MDIVPYQDATIAESRQSLKLLNIFLKGKGQDSYFYRADNSIKFDRDKTLWLDPDSIDVSITIRISSESDSEIFSFISRFSEDVGDKSEISLKVRAVSVPDMEVSHSSYVNGVPQDDKATIEVIKKLKSSKSLILHNSTLSRSNFFYMDDSYVEVLDAHFTADDRKNINAAQKNLENKIRKATKKHKSDLDALLGKLQDKFHVELSAIGSIQSSTFPLQIKLNDKVAEVSLQEWGAGTQNRTRVFLSILDAQRTKDAASADNRSTPVFLVEEPESFLHPSAQAEFGQVLNSLADEFGIQIIATTHSPYMLNQSSPESNYLLERKLFRKAPRETVLARSEADNWMAPFAENLGVITSEFHDWKSAFFARSSKVLFVEGEIDKEYFELLKDKYPELYKVREDVEIVPYEGKDALKNTALLRFMINKFKRVFFTFDLDAEREVVPSLQRLGLVEGKDFAAVGTRKAGCECIEGLLPDSVKKAVHAINVDDVNAMMSADNSIRRSARQRLKRAYLEYMRQNNVKEAELVAFRVLMSRISSAFG